MVREKGKNKLGPGLPEERNFETARNMTELSELHRFSPMNYETCCLGGGGGGGGGVCARGGGSEETLEHHVRQIGNGIH